MHSRIPNITIIIMISCVATLQAGVSRELRERLRREYENQTVTFTRNGLFMASYWTNLPGGSGRNNLHANIAIHHFHDVTQVPKRVPVEFRILDNQTLENSVASFTTPIEQGSPFTVDQVDASGEQIDFWLRAKSDAPAGIMGLTEEQIQAGARSHMGIRIRFYFRNRVLDAPDAYTKVKGEIATFFALPQDEVASKATEIEKQIESGRGLAEEVERNQRVLIDAMVVEYIDRTGQNLVKHSDAVFPFHFKVLDTDSFEFITLSGGFIFLSRALIPAFANEAELAGFMAHAIADIVIHSEDKRSALPRPGGLSIAEPIEAQADFRALRYLYDSAYDPKYYMSGMQKLNSIKTSETRESESLGGHRLTNDRVASLKAAMAAMTPKNQYLVNSGEFEEVKKHLLTPSVGERVPAAKPGLPAEKIDIHIGMTRDEVIRALGSKWVEFVVADGKTTLHFIGITVELIDGKVVAVRVN